MLHEILLSLSGHPSPLLRSAQASDPNAAASSLISPPERELLRGVAHLSDLHVKLLSFSAQLAASHPSMICRAVATAVDNTHLAAFQRKVLEVEETILRKDAGLVGAYNIVPLTAVVGEFDGWTRRMEWLWELVQFMLRKERSADGGEAFCTGAAVIDRLCGELQTGYCDIEETARSLVRVAETAWVKQVSAWILYGRLPGFGGEDFFIQRPSDTEEDFVCVSRLLPSFVTAPTAASMLFIGRSLNHIRTKGSLEGGMQGMDHLSSQLRELSQLTYPLDSATFSRTVTSIRLFLSRNTLQKLLPLSRVLEMLHLLRGFFLLGRGEFAMALTQQADEKIRSRWRRAVNLAHEKRDGLNNVVVKEGEVIAVLTRTWAAMGSMQGHQVEEDEGLEMARDLLKLTLAKSRSSTPSKLGPSSQIVSTPFCNLMFTVPVTLTMRVPSPLDLFLSASDVQTYTAINSYLHSVRRAHLRLTDLWKITPLRRHHPPPPKPAHGSTKAGRARVIQLRERQGSRMLDMRSTWTTCSAAIFFLAEVEGYLQIEVVAELWEGFQRWLTTGSDEYRPPESTRPSRLPTPTPEQDPDAMDEDESEGTDMWLAEGTMTPRPRGAGKEDKHPHDPQTLAAAHRIYLSTLVRRLLLSQQDFTDPLYNLLVEIDQLVALVHRLQDIWNSMDLEEDVGVVDAFVDLEREEKDVKAQIKAVEGKIKGGIEGVIGILRNLEADHEGLAWGNDDAAEAVQDGEGGGGLREEGQYVPRRVGGVDRLLMKLDFGSWFDRAKGDNAEADNYGA
ncbi:Gamma-tubulin complex component 4 [Cytospora mali]|uniref:Spindle pole body component n=1 Tax=Cytospora mali TaxID=578113 RepID=A0A194V8N7_CYTMA|nr:Gamma-tubulin complex component 4 [Valsa mali var. pyri (nom. inval.)]